MRKLIPAALAVVAVVLAFSVRTGATLARSAGTLPANGTASMTLRLEAHSLLGLRPAVALRPRLTLSFDEGRSLVRASCSASETPVCTLLAGVAPGQVSGTLEARDALGPLVRERFSLALAADEADSDSDGLPDAVELRSEEDREAFRRWFAAIAEGQYYALDPQWPKVHHDCAGLLRFAYKEALKHHDDAWRKRRKYLPDSSMPDVAKYAYPGVPILGERLFRVAPGPYRPGEDVATTFSASASAKWLLAENAVHIPARDAKIGDLLFFEDTDSPGMGFHSMIYLGATDPDPALAPADDQPDGWVVYHTGPEGESGGTVRRVRLSQLLSHPDEKWRPRADNPHFLGFYRWKIVN